MAASVLKCQGLSYKVLTSCVVQRVIVANGGRYGCVLSPASQRRCFMNKVFGKKNSITGTTSSSELGTKDDNVTRELALQDDYVPELEKFIPITRRSIIRHIMQEEHFLNMEELQKFQGFSQALDSAVVNKYHGILQDLKNLFDPINPDKDTIATRQWNRRERLDNEFWLMQNLSHVMEKANFHELNKAVIERALKEHQSTEGVLVSVNPDNYDILRIWALGRETSQETLPYYKRLGYSLLRKPIPKPLEYYKRTIVAVRLKRDDKLILKAFKEVPINALEQLLPDGKIKMSQFDKTIISTSIGVASLGLLAKLVTYLAKVEVQWTLLLSGVAALTTIRAWTVYKNRRNAYLVDLSRMLYFKNIANNRGLLTLLVDRAEDELFKEALLVYTFILTNRPPSAIEEDALADDLGGMPQVLLEKTIEDWVQTKTKTKVKFNADEAIRLLKELGICGVNYNSNLTVLALDSAMGHLPLTHQSLVDRFEEYDVIEGFDRHVSEETDDEYKAEDKTRKKYGWF